MAAFFRWLAIIVLLLLVGHIALDATARFRQRKAAKAQHLLLMVSVNFDAWRVVHPRSSRRGRATMPSEGPATEAAVGYSIGLWHLLNGRPDAARKYFQRSLDSKLPTSWGARAAEAELRRLSAPVAGS